ncbi:MAG: alpha/beta fold hydrolase [Acidimicrobiia bacterium]|nr:alpha/beta fold hydrolase [Acidimicrobiia bacterium]
MQFVSRMADPVQRVAVAVRRPATYAGHAREVVSTALTVGAWPFGLVDPGLDSLVDRDEESPVPTPVLLVHGYGANRSNWGFLSRHLRQAGFGRVHALNYNPLRADVPHLAELCAARATAVMEHFDSDRVHIVGHSLGGLIARYAVQVLGLRGVDTCATVASPHGGVRLARYGTALSELSPLDTSRQLRPDSPVIELLRSSARPLPTRFVAYYSNLDLIVPARRAMILEAELEATNLLVKDHGHLSIMWSRQLASSIVDQLGAAEGLPGYGAPVAPLRSRAASASGGPHSQPARATGSA